MSGIQKLLTDAKLVNAEFALDPANQPFAQVRAAFNDDGERSFRYIIPAVTKVALTWGDDSVGESRQQIAQFGLVASLPASSGGKSLNYALAFYESTGALKSFKLASKAVLQKATVDTISSQANTLIDAKKKADDELTVLDREQKILAAKKSIFDNCKALNLACGGYVPPAPQP